MNTKTKRLILSTGLAGLFCLLLVAAPALLARPKPTPTPMPTPTPAPTPTTTPTPPPSTGSSFAVAYSATVAESVSQASSGSFVVGAFCDGPNCNGPATVLRVDSSGNIQSQTQYSYGAVPQSTALDIIKATSDGGAIYAGQPQFGCPAQNLNSCGEIVKVNSTGTVQWANDLLFATSAPRTYSAPSTWTNDIQQTSDGGYVLVGYANAPSENYNPWIAKLSSTGQVQWTHVFPGANNEYGYGLSVRQTSDGGYIVGGDANYVFPSYTESEIDVFKLDSTGALVWQRDYAAGTGVYFDSLALTSDGGFIVSGSVSQQQTSSTYTSSVLLLKLDLTGNTQFARTYLPSGDISDLNIAGAQQTSDGGYAFAGYYFQNTIYDERAWMVKTDASGTVRWNKIYGPDVQYSDRTFRSFQQASDGGFIAAGSTNQFNLSGGNSSWLVKTDSNGNISNCTDVHNDSLTTGSVTVTVSNGDLSAVKDGFSYVADSLIPSSPPLVETKECPTK